MDPITRSEPEVRPSLVEHLPGLAIVGALAVASTIAARWLGSISALTIGVAIGAIVGNLWALVSPVPEAAEIGIRFAASKLLRAGVVLLGFRLALSDLTDLGVGGLGAVVMVVTGTFFGTRWLASLMGISPNLGLLIATGYSICGASAIAAMDGVIDAEEEETAYAVALVTLCGSLSIVVFPPIGHLLNMSPVAFGSWAGAGIHDVAQVIATATTFDPTAVESATVVKLTRVVLLAPLVTGVALARSARGRNTTPDADGSEATTIKRPRPIPLFVVGFLSAVVLRSTGWLSDDLLSDIKSAEKWLLTLALVALGLGVRLVKLKQLGGRPLVLGLVSWVWVATAAFAGVAVFT